MDFDTSFRIKLLSDKTGRWSLQEIDSEGKHVGSRLEPWDLGLNFEILDIRHLYGLESDSLINHASLNNDEDGAEDLHGTAAEFKGIERISATLRPAKNRYRRPSFSMMGTDRTISDMRLLISKSETDSCGIAGTVRYTSEIDFRKETTSDSLEIYIQLAPPKFDDLARMINAAQIADGFLRVSTATGFYSAWTPETSTDFFKVLSPSNEAQKIENSQTSKISPPRLGSASGFHLNFRSKLQAPSKEITGSEGAQLAKELAEAEVKYACSYLKSEADGTQTRTVNEDKAAILRNSQKYNLIIELFTAAHNYNNNSNTDATLFDNLTDEIFDVLHEVEYAFCNHLQKAGDDPQDKDNLSVGRWDFWQARKVDFKEIAKQNVPYIDRFALTSATTKYLSLPIRSQRMDRMLVDALIADEIIAFADQMLKRPNVSLGISGGELTKGHPLWRFIKGQSKTIFYVAVVPCILLFGVSQIFEIGGNWLFLFGLLFAGVALLGLLFGTMFLPWFWISETRRKNKILKMLDAMNGVHTEVVCGGLTSARHIRRRLEKTCDEGIIWPAEVFALVDDIVDRGRNF